MSKICDKSVNNKVSVNISMSQYAPLKFVIYNVWNFFEIWKVCVLYCEGTGVFLFKLQKRKKKRNEVTLSAIQLYAKLFNLEQFVCFVHISTGLSY